MSPERRRQSIPRLVLVPALVTLALTQLQLTGDLLGWSEMGLPFEIAWLVPLCGTYFALHLRRVDESAPSAARVLRGTFLPLALFIAGSSCCARHPVGWGFCRSSPSSSCDRIGLGFGNTLLTYAFAARLPVIVTMLAATLGRWETVFDVSPYNVLAGTLPQLTVWFAFTRRRGQRSGVGRPRLARTVPRPRNETFPGSTAPG